MALKSISLKLDERTVEAIKVVCDVEDIKQAEFYADAVEHYINYLATIRTGGMNLEIPSPYNFIVSEEKKQNIVEFMNEASYQYSKIAGTTYDLGLTAIKKFVEHRFNPDNEAREREGFQDTFKKYCEIQNIMKGGKSDA